MKHFYKNTNTLSLFFTAYRGKEFLNKVIKAIYDVIPTSPGCSSLNLNVQPTMELGSWLSP